MWCAVYDEIRDHPKTRALAKSMGCNRQEAIGTLVCLWLWGLNNADRDGRLIDASPEDIAEGIMSRERPADSLVDSLVDSGWIDRSGDTYFLHDWDTWQEVWFKALERREYDAQRKREARAKKASGDTFPDCPADSPADSPMDSPMDSPVENPRTVDGKSGVTVTLPNRNRNLTDNNTSFCLSGDSGEEKTIVDTMDDETKAHLIRTSLEFGFPISDKMVLWGIEHGVIPKE